MTAIPEDYSMHSIEAKDLEPGDIIRGEGGGKVAEKPVEDRDPIHRELSHAIVRFADGETARFLPTQIIDIYRRRKSRPPPDM